MAPKAKFGPWKDGRRFVWVDEAQYEEDERRPGLFTPVSPHQKPRSDSPTPRNQEARYRKGPVDPEPSSSHQEPKENRDRQYEKRRSEAIPKLPPDDSRNFELARTKLPTRHRSSKHDQETDESDEEDDPVPELAPRKSTSYVPQSYTKDHALSLANTDDPRTKLSPVASAFIQIPLSEFRQCRQFIDRSPSILREDTQSLLNYAIETQKLNRPQDVLQCIQGMLLIQECQARRGDDRYKYLECLVDKRRSVLKEFYEKSKTIAAAVQKSSAKEGLPSRETRTSRNNSSGTTSSAGWVSAKPVTTASSARPDLGLGGFQSLDIAGGGSSGLSRHETRLPSAQYPMIADPMGLGRPFHFDPHPAPGATVGNDNQKSPRSQIPLKAHRPRGNSGSTISNGPLVRLKTVALSEVDFRGTPPITPIMEKLDKLDKRYIRRKEAFDFFGVGRVFAVLFHENMGDGRRKKRSKSAQDLNDRPNYVTKGPYGEDIFSHIRRMVVIEKKRAFCWCIPINSYSGNGTASKNFHTEELEAHAIIHNAIKEPRLVKGEQGLTKDPIAVVMAKDQDLEKASRIHFGKPYTVEYSTKTMDVGMIAQKSMAKFRAYCREEFSVFEP